MENAVITNEGRALLTSVIANNGTLTFTVAKVSDTDYVGQEATLTIGTFAGTFMEQTVSASVQNTTTIKVATTIYDSGNNHITEAHEIKSVGIVATDGNTTALLLVCTTSNPSTIEPGNDPNDPTSLDVEVNLGVSSTQNITVVGSAAGVLHTSDVVDNLTSTAVNEPLSANMGRVLDEQSSAVTNVYSAKNLNSYPYYETSKTDNGITWTINDNGSITVSGVASGTSTLMIHSRRDTDPNGLVINNGTYIISGGISTPVGINVSRREKITGSYEFIGADTGSGLTVTLNGDYYSDDTTLLELNLFVDSGTDLTTPVIFYPMIRDARITDDTFAPYSKTNLQLTEDVSNLSNENLIDNPWFTVNQRGVTSGGFDVSYKMDRWKTSYTSNVSGTWSLSSSGLSVNTTNASSGNNYFAQTFSASLDAGKLYTASVMLSDGTVLSGTITSFPTSLAVPFGSLYITTSDITITIGAGTTVIIRAVKLEVGSKSTLAHDVEPNYTTELLKCQRYFYRLKALSSYAIVSVGTMDDATAFWGTITLPVPMRATPQVTTAGTIYIRQGTNVNTSSVTCELRSPNILSVFAVAVSSLTSGAPALLLLGSTASYIDLSAEL